MLVECGFTRAIAADGSEWTFRPSLARIASLGSPREIVRTFAALHGPNAAAEAVYVLACLCEQDDATPLIGWFGPGATPGTVRWHPGQMPEAEMILIARHLMLHGIVGRSSPDRGDGGYSEEFNAAEFVAAARVHLGMSSSDAEALSMTELQLMLEMKFPQAGRGGDIPSEDEYEQSMQALCEVRDRHVASLQAQEQVQ